MSGQLRLRPAIEHRLERRAIAEQPRLDFPNRNEHKVRLESVPWNERVEFHAQRLFDSIIKVMKDNKEVATTIGQVLRPRLALAAQLSTPVPNELSELEGRSGSELASEFVQRVHIAGVLSDHPNELAHLLNRSMLPVLAQRTLCFEVLAEREPLSARHRRSQIHY